LTVHRIEDASVTVKPMVPRDPHEPHRTATPLELFFDLAYVVAIAQAGVALHHAEAEGHFFLGITRYLMVFFAIWWAWMNFTWFATSFDTDDWLYRLTTVVQIGGSLTLAAGVPRMMSGESPDVAIVTIGYVIMRMAMVSQWLRAATQYPSCRPTTLRYALGIGLAQLYWAAYALGAFGGSQALFWLGATLELAVPVWAERHGHTPWHRHHIAERYGLFTIIVLGESMLASTNAVIHAAGSAEHLPSLVLIAATALVIVAAMWWLYFAVPQHGLIADLRTSVLWGYGHFLIFLGAAAIAPGIEVALQYATHEVSLEATRAAMTYTAPTALYVFVVWLLILRRLLAGAVNLIMPFGAALILASAAGPHSLQVTAALMVGLVMVTAVSPRRERAAVGT
jgi:low temperature requirement protein LtrA